MGLPVDFKPVEPPLQFCEEELNLATVRIQVASNTEIAKVSDSQKDGIRIIVAR